MRQGIYSCYSQFSSNYDKISIKAKWRLSFMNILVHGAGALGAYFVEAVRSRSKRFIFVEKTGCSINKEGLKISSPEGTFRARSNCVYIA